MFSVACCFDVGNKKEKEENDIDVENGYKKETGKKMTQKRESWTKILLPYRLQDRGKS